MHFGKGLVVMQGQTNPNLMILELAVNALGTLADDMVFLGGCATGLLITDPAAPVIRATKGCRCHHRGCFVGGISSVI